MIDVDLHQSMKMNKSCWEYERLDESMSYHTFQQHNGLWHKVKNILYIANPLISIQSPHNRGYASVQSVNVFLKSSIIELQQPVKTTVGCPSESNKNDPEKKHVPIN